MERVEIGQQPAQQDLATQLEHYAERLHVRLPAAPLGLVEGYVRFAPWLAMVFGAFGLFGTFALFLVGTALSPILLLGGGSALHSGMGAFLVLALGLIGSALEITGGYLMLRCRLTGWWMIGGALAISAANGLLTFSLLGTLLTLAIGYIHLQAKPRYRD